MSEEKLNEDIPADESVIAEEEQAEEAEVLEEPSVEEQLVTAKEEAAQNMDSFLRAQAELSNARKRFEKRYHFSIFEQSIVECFSRVLEQEGK